MISIGPGTPASRQFLSALTTGSEILTNLAEHTAGRFGHSDAKTAWSAPVREAITNAILSDATSPLAALVNDTLTGVASVYPTGTLNSMLKHSAREGLQRAAATLATLRTEVLETAPLIDDWAGGIEEMAARARSGALNATDIEALRHAASRVPSELAESLQAHVHGDAAAVVADLAAGKVSTLERSARAFEVVNGFSAEQARTTLDELSDLQRGFENIGNARTLRALFDDPRLAPHIESVIGTKGRANVVFSLDRAIDPSIAGGRARWYANSPFSMVGASHEIETRSHFAALRASAQATSFDSAVGRAHSLLDKPALTADDIHELAALVGRVPEDVQLSSVVRSTRPGTSMADSLAAIAPSFNDTVTVDATHELTALRTALNATDRAANAARIAELGEIPSRELSRRDLYELHTLLFRLDPQVAPHDARALEQLGGRMIDHVAWSKSMARGTEPLHDDGVALNVDRIRAGLKTSAEDQMKSVAQRVARLHPEAGALWQHSSWQDAQGVASGLAWMGDHLEHMRAGGALSDAAVADLRAGIEESIARVSAGFDRSKGWDLSREHEAVVAAADPAFTAIRAHLGDLLQ